VLVGKKKKIIIIMCGQRAQTPSRLLHCRNKRLVRIYRTKPYFRNVNGNRKVFVDPAPDPDSDQHGNVTTSRGSSLASPMSTMVGRHP